MTLTVTAGEQALESGTYFKVERWDGVGWAPQHYVQHGEAYPADTDAFDDDAYGIEPGGTLTEELPLRDLEDGVHRVGLEMWVGGDEVAAGSGPVAVYARLDVEGENTGEVPTSTAWSEPAAYAYTLAAWCGLWPLNGTFRVDVADGTVTEAAPLDTTAEEYLATHAEAPPTIGELVALVDRAVADDADSVDVSQTEDGRPTRIAINYDVGVIDDERCFEITDYGYDGGSVGTATTEESTVSPAEREQVELNGTWRSTEVKGIDLEEDTQVAITFGEDRFSADIACNTMTAPYQIEGGRLEVVYEAASETDMGCPQMERSGDRWLLRVADLHSDNRPAGRRADHHRRSRPADPHSTGFGGLGRGRPGRP